MGFAKSFQFSWRSVSSCSREHVAFLFAYNGGQHLIYDCLQPIATHIRQYASTKIVDAASMLISRIG